MQLTIRGGHRLEQTTPGKAGINELTANMLNESTEQYTGEQMAAALEQLGSQIQVFGSDSETLVFVQSLTKNLPATLALLDQRLLHPRFDQADFDRLKKQQLEKSATSAPRPR